MPSQDVLVTVAIPVHNGARFLGAALRSARDQTHRALEILVFDDGSTDGSAAVVRELDDERVRLLSASQNSGVSAARQALKTAARGDYIAWLDADDIYEPQRVEVLLGAARRTGADIVTDASSYLSEDGAPRPGERRVPDRIAADPFFTRLFERNAMNPHPLVSRACFEAIDFDPELTVSEDYDFWLKASHAGYRFRRVDAVLHRYRLVDGSLSSDPRAARAAVRRILARYPLPALKELYRSRGLDEDHVRYMACLQHVFRGEYAAAVACTMAPWPNEDQADRDFYRGSLELACGQDEAAGPFLRRHLEKWPESPAGLNNLGVWQRRRGQTDRAIWERALALFPGYQDAIANREGRETVTLTQLAPRRYR